MDPIETHRRACSVFAEVLAAVDDADLARPTPCTEWNVADLIAHVVDGHVGATEQLGAAPEPLPDGDRVARHAAAAAQAQQAFAAPDALTRLVELPFAHLPAAVFCSIRSGDVYAHAWDLATAIGVDTDLDPELGEAIRAATAPILSPALRGEGRPFGEEQPCAADRPVADRLAALLGRPV